MLCGVVMIIIAILLGCSDYLLINDGLFDPLNKGLRPEKQSRFCGIQLPLLSIKGFCVQVRLGIPVYFTHLLLFLVIETLGSHKEK